METTLPTASDLSHADLSALLALPLGELRDAARILMDDIKKIDTELGQPRRYRDDGTMYSIVEFHQWRHDAKFAKEAMARRYRELKEEIRKRADAEFESGKSNGNNNALLTQLLDEQRRANELLERISDLLEAGLFDPEDEAKAS